MSRLLLALLLVATAAYATRAQSPGSGPAASQQPRSVLLYVMRVRPEPEWETIYHEVERCSGRVGDAGSVSWYVTDHAVQGDSGSRARSRPSGRSVGLWQISRHGDRQIIVIRGDTATVRHEALHDVLWVSGVRGAGLDHPWPLFGRCAAREAE